MALLVPLTFPGSSNNFIDTSFSTPDTGLRAVTNWTSKGNVSWSSRLSRNGSIVSSIRTGRSSWTLSPISTKRLANHSPSPVLSRVERAISMLVLNWIKRSLVFSGGPSWIPSNFTPKCSSNVEANA